MALKYFLMYAGVFFGSSLAILPLIKLVSAGFGNHGRKPLIFSVVPSVLISGAAFGSTYATDSFFYTYWILSGIFFIFGLLFVALIYKKFFKARKDNRNKQTFAGLLYGTSVVLMCVAIFSSLQYFLKNENFMWFPTMLSLLFFFIPILLLHTFDAAMDIPPPQYDNWQHPVAPIELPDEKEGERLYVIGFEISKKATDAVRTYFRAKAPQNMLLGDLFYHFVNDYNDLYSETPIDFGVNGNNGEWIFRTKPKWYTFSKILAPGLTVDQNKIKENTVIICERMEG